MRSIFRKYYTRGIYVQNLAKTKTAALPFTGYVQGCC